MGLRKLFVLSALVLAACSSLQNKMSSRSTATYDLLADTRPAPLGPKAWIGNVKWFAEETDDRLSLTFRTMPKDQAEAEYVALTQIVGSDKKVASFPSARRTLFRMRLPEWTTVSQVTYRPDGLEAKTSGGEFSVTMPLHRFGAIVEGRPSGGGLKLMLDSPRMLGSKLVTMSAFRAESGNGREIWTDGHYTIVFRYDASFQSEQDNIEHVQAAFSSSSRSIRVAIAFHMDRDKAIAEADDLFAHADDVRATSRSEWSDYLNSCPVTHFPNRFHTHDPATNRDLNYSDAELYVRQLWHWQVALANCYDIEFNDMPAQLCPDKSTWFGSWSNDTPGALGALAHTNQRGFVRRALIEYVRVGITSEGDLTWYMHGTEVRGLGNPRDVGRMSHGVPAIITAVADYVATTGDASILKAKAGDDMTVWQKLRTYMMNVFKRRPTSADGLVAWANLWEGGADDKVGPFFSKADIGAWCKAVENMNDADLKAFYAENSRPVVNLYEQAFFLNALRGMQKLAARAKDAEAGEFAREKYEHVVRVLHDKQWSEADGFYCDLDLKKNELVHVKNQDTFYLLRYLPNDRERTEKVLGHLHNPEEFALPFTPTLAKNDPGFKADGYWCGGYWPREAAPIAYGLAAVGDKGEAELLLVKALMSSSGKVVLENVNPVTGKTSTPIQNMAYSVQLVMALREIHGSAATGKP